MSHSKRRIRSRKRNVVFEREGFELSGFFVSILVVVVIVLFSGLVHYWNFYGPMRHCVDIIGGADRLAMTGKITSCVLMKVLMDKLRNDFENLTPDQKEFAKRIISREHISIKECARRHFGLEGHWKNKVYDSDILTNELLIDTLKLLGNTLIEYDRAVYGEDNSKKLVSTFENIEEEDNPEEFLAEKIEHLIERELKRSYMYK